MRFLLSLFVFFVISNQLIGQVPKLKSTSWRDNWKIEIKTGLGILLTEVPKKYLDRLNSVNIPLKALGTTQIISVRKGLTSHLEMGYQFDYMRIGGNVNQDNLNYHVLTQAFGNSFFTCYNFKGTNDFRPRLNYFAYYKIGSISLKNDPKEIMEDGTLFPVAGPSQRNKFLQNVAVITGVGIGFNYQFANNLSLVATADLNRSSDVVSDIYKINKIFYQSTNTVNNFVTTAFGLCYTFNFSEQKKSDFFKSRTETERKLLQSKITRRKGPSVLANLPVWYKHKHGL